jgi:ribosome-binding factor A
MSQRTERVGQEIQVAIGEMVSRGDLRDPRIGFITITGVKMSPDLRVAKVFYSLLNAENDEKARKDTQAGLDAAKGYIRREVSSRLNLRFSPEIFFSFDASVGEGDKIDRLLREVKQKEGW